MPAASRSLSGVPGNSRTVCRSSRSGLEDGTEVKLGVFLSNSKSRRAKLTAGKLKQLADLGLEWAA